MNCGNHIYGFDDGYAFGDDMEEERQKLIMLPGIKCDIQFNFCPICGEKL